LKNPVTVFVKSRATSENVNQDVVYVNGREGKVEVLHELLLKEEFRKVLVFSKTKHGAEKLAKTLFERGFKAGAIHGDLSQSQRERSLLRFREDQLRVLVATDVAARGLDIDGITHVINYDLPMTYEDYIHRIGRTGRGTNIGYALTFVERFEAEVRSSAPRSFSYAGRGRR
jgi:superfamily II DNA/RNA helicase